MEQGFNPAASVNMTELAYVSALALALTQRGSGFLGTLHSAW